MKQQNKQLLIIGGIVVIALIAVGVLILATSSANTITIDYASLPQSRTADGGFVIGNEDAPITIVEFADWACPHCQQYHPEVQRFIQDFVVTGLAKFEYRVFPTTGGQVTVFMGQVAECAEEQRPGAFWEVYDMLYVLVDQGLLNGDAGRVVAERLGLSYSEILTCTADSTRVAVDSQLGQTNGVTGTPGVRMRNGNGPLQTISTYSSGSVPYSVLASVVNQANNLPAN